MSSHGLSSMHVEIEMREKEKERERVQSGISFSYYKEGKSFRLGSHPYE